MRTYNKCRHSICTLTCAEFSISSKAHVYWSSSCWSQKQGHSSLYPLLPSLPSQWKTHLFFIKCSSKASALPMYHFASACTSNQSSKPFFPSLSDSSPWESALPWGQICLAMSRAGNKGRGEVRGGEEAKAQECRGSVGGGVSKHYRVHSQLIHTSLQSHLVPSLCTWPFFHICTLTHRCATVSGFQNCL